MAIMEFIFNNMPKFDRKTYSLSDWLIKLEKRFDLVKIDEGEQKISIARLFNGGARTHHVFRREKL